LVREPGRLSATFRKFPEYLASDPESPFPGPAWFAERGVELSRGFKALKVWMGWKTHGTRGYAAAIESDVRLAHFLAKEIDGRKDFERLAETFRRSIVETFEQGAHSDRLIAKSCVPLHQQLPEGLGIGL
jgi:glutamate/tyrosine decarboxylase-like PLP-dependent enzyme